MAPICDQLIRRAQSTLRFYDASRKATQAYLEGNDPCNPKIEQYYEALASWEATLLNWAICVDLFRSMQNTAVFAKGDGSSAQRAHLLHNTIKHHAADISAGKMSADDNVAFWITNQGVTSRTTRLSFDELAELVREVARLAGELQGPWAFTSQPTGPEG